MLPEEVCEAPSRVSKAVDNTRACKLTALNAVAVVPLAHVRAPLEMAQMPLEVDLVKLLVVPEELKLTSVWVDHFPAVRSPLVAEPLTRAFTVPLVGRLPEQVP